MKLAIIVGHNSSAKGAKAAAPIGEYEFDYNERIAARMLQASADYGLETKKFNRSSGGGYTQEIREVYSRTDAWRAEVTVELHFNAFNRSTIGTETLCGPSANSFKTADAIQKVLVDLLDRGVGGDRGVKTYRPGMRGAASLISGRAPAVLVEPFFGDAPADARLAFNVGEESLARAYLLGVSLAWGTDVASNVDEVEELLDFAHAM